MTITLFLIALSASVLGSICGIGGGVIIKPILDAMNIMSVSAISFLSGCTVLAMAIFSVGKSVVSGRTQINRRITPMLGMGAALGGMLGKTIFSQIKQLSGNEAMLGLIQAILLCLVTVATLVYMLANMRGKVRTHLVRSSAASSAIGLVLGMVSAFLGIGGGPINLAVLTHFFSMNAKEAGINSLCIILLSQIFALGQTLLAGQRPIFEISHLTMMVLGGILGGLVGQFFKQKLTEDRIAKLFNLVTILVIAICSYNILHFASL